MLPSTSSSSHYLASLYHPLGGAQPGQQGFKLPSHQQRAAVPPTGLSPALESPCTQMGEGNLVWVVFLVTGHWLQWSGMGMHWILPGQGDSSFDKYQSPQLRVVCSLCRTGEKGGPLLKTFSWDLGKLHSIFNSITDSPHDLRQVTSSPGVPMKQE